MLSVIGDPFFIGAPVVLREHVRRYRVDFVCVDRFYFRLQLALKPGVKVRAHAYASTCAQRRRETEA